MLQSESGESVRETLMERRFGGEVPIVKAHDFQIRQSFITEIAKREVDALNYEKQVLAMTVHYSQVLSAVASQFLDDVAND